MGVRCREQRSTVQKQGSGDRVAARGVQEPGKYTALRREF